MGKGVLVEMEGLVVLVEMVEMVDQVEHLCRGLPIVVVAPLELQVPQEILDLKVTKALKGIQVMTV